MKISLGISPCPNDTYIFYAIINKKIDLHGFEFEVVFEDVETLNLNAFKNQLDITKLSMNAYFSCIDNYKFLDSGAALGFKNGPLLISKSLTPASSLSNKLVGIPGLNTTANLLLSIAMPSIKNKQIMLFSDIIRNLANDSIAAGLIIHESRFIYKNFNLNLILDLGEWWYKQYSLPLPLGCIAMSRKFNDSTITTIEKIIYESICYANKHPEECLPFIKAHSQEKDEIVIQQHIDLYVNDYSLSLGETGRRAIKKLNQLAIENNIVKK